MTKYAIITINENELSCTSLSIYGTRAEAVNSVVNAVKTVWEYGDMAEADRPLMDRSMASARENLEKYGAWYSEDGDNRLYLLKEIEV